MRNSHNYKMCIHYNIATTALTLFITVTLFSCNAKSVQQEQSPPLLNIENMETSCRDTIYESMKLNKLIWDLMVKKTDTTKALIGLYSNLDYELFDSSIPGFSYPYIIYDTLLHNKKQGKFTLQFDDGNTLTFKDIRDDGDAYCTYHYIGYLSNLKKYIISTSFYEDYTCLLLDRKDGTMTVLPSIPLFNENGTRLIVQDADPYIDQTTLYI